MKNVSLVEGVGSQDNNKFELVKNKTCHKSHFQLWIKKILFNKI